MRTQLMSVHLAPRWMTTDSLMADCWLAEWQGSSTWLILSSLFTFNLYSTEFIFRDIVYTSISLKTEMTQIVEIHSCDWQGAPISNTVVDGDLATRLIGTDTNTFNDLHRREFDKWEINTNTNLTLIFNIWASNLGVYCSLNSILSNSILHKGSYSLRKYRHNCFSWTSGIS